MELLNVQQLFHPELTQIHTRIQSAPPHLLIVSKEMPLTAFIFIHFQVFSYRRDGMLLLLADVFVLNA